GAAQASSGAPMQSRPDPMRTAAGASIRASTRASGEAAIEGEHRLEQHVGARGEMLGLGVLDLVVADAALAGHEDHRRPVTAGDVDRVVAGAARDASMGMAESARRAFD